MGLDPRDKHNTTAFFTARVIRFMLVIASFCVFPTSMTYAQDRTTLTLKEGRDYEIAYYAYVTPDPHQRLNPDTLMDRYKNNLRGTKIRSDVIKINNAQYPIWIIFTVHNKSPIQNWILNFGDSLSGRSGMIKQINILNYSTKQTLNFPVEKSSSEKSEKNSIVDNPFIGAALALDIKSDTQNTFILRLEAQEGFPLIFYPKLVPQYNYMHQLIKGDIGHVIASILFIGISTFFIAVYYIYRNKAALILASYYMILCALFFNFSGSIIPHSIITGPVLFALYMAGYLLLITATRYYCNLRYHKDPLENIALIALCGLIIIGTLLYLSVMGTSATGLLLMSGLISICMLILLTILFFSNERSNVNTLLFATGPALAAFAFILLALINADMIPVSSGMVSAFWYIHVLQGAFFIAACLHTRIHQEQKDQHEAKEEQRDKQSLARLQKSKESADQARLIRVIERERELMSELREREVKRTEEMRIAKESADRANKAKSAFLAVVSHEIRTPMNGTLGMVQLLQKTTLSKAQLEYVEIIRKSGDTMMSLLNDILDFEKIESGRMTLEILNFDLYRLVNDIVILMSGHASQKNVSLSTGIDKNDVPRVVSGDPTRLRQVLLNLINNAIKFTERGNVTINVTRLRSENPKIKDKIRIAVKDTGIGISEEGMKKLFTPFTQAESSTVRKYGGTGLGLTISYRLIEAMDGQINVRSTEGKGSVFFFDLDMIIQDEQGQDKAVPDEHFLGDTSVHVAKPMNILVTVDNEMNRKVLDGLLSQQGHTLFMASNGLEALDICRKQKPDLVLMDIQMDGMDGLETTKRLRAEPDPAVANIPVIAITGNVMLEDIQNFFEIGMNGFLAKPVDSKKLDEVIYNASIGKFENNPKHPDEQQKDGSVKTSEITPENKQECIVSSISAAAEEKTSAHALKKNTHKKEIDLSDINTGLSLDNREYFVADSALKPRNSRLTKGPLDDADTTSFSFADGNAGNENPPERQSKIEDEVTEIQRFLMEKDGTAPAKLPETPKPAPEITPQTEPLAVKTANVVPPSEPVAPAAEPVIAPAPEPVSTPAPEPVIAPVPEPVTATIEQNEDQKEPDNNELNYDIEQLLDENMLNQLLGTLGKDQFFSLLDGFKNKANEIIDVIEELADGKNMATLSSRAHELKGLAGNFGMKQLSMEADEIEKSARTGQKENAIELAKGLMNTGTQTEKALSDWTKQQQ